MRTAFVLMHDFSAYVGADPALRACDGMSRSVCSSLCSGCVRVPVGQGHVGAMCCLSMSVRSPPAGQWGKECQDCVPVRPVCVM